MKNDRGLTLIEIIVVLLVIGIIGAVIVSRISSTSAYDLKSQTEIIKSHIRYAQARAMNSTVSWGIRFHDATSYFLYRDGNYNSKVMLPGEDSYTLTLPGGMSINKNSRTFSFDSWGIPHTNKKATKPQTNDVRTTKVQFEGLSEKIIISKNTGFIQ